MAFSSGAARGNKLPLSDLIGQPRAARQLIRALGHLAHAYLFVGPEDVGKQTAALAFAQALQCTDEAQPGCGNCQACQAVMASNHPDVRFWDLLEGEKTFKIEQVRQLVQALALKSYHGRRKVHVLVALDALAVAGANALLKTLEEPPPDTTLVLLSRDAENLLPTIVSRCQLVPFGLMPPLALAEALVSRFGLGDEAAIALAHQSQGRVGRAMTLAKTPQPALLLPEFPDAQRPWLWADAWASKPEAEQTVHLEALLSVVRDASMLVSGTDALLCYPLETPRLREIALALPLEAWLLRARSIEEARASLRRRANAKLVFDALAKAFC
jgi:DNA polymerase-3 subunit delta'